MYHVLIQLSLQAFVFIAAMTLSFSYESHFITTQVQAKEPHNTKPISISSSQRCPTPQTAMDVIKCAQKENPTVVRASLATKQSEGLIDVAKQIPNPDLELQSGFDRLSGTNKSNLHIAIRQPIEWGGKRSARINTALAQQRQAVADQMDLEADVIIETVVHLYRLKQLSTEKSSLSNTIDALNKIIRQQQSRAAMTPDQKGSLAIYRMALADAKIRASEVFEEERRLERFFQLTTGLSLSNLIPVLPQPLINWPKLPNTRSAETVSTGLNLALAQKDLAKAQVDTAVAMSWPNLSLGPQVAFDRDGMSSDTLYGLALSMDLPVFQRNGAGRAFAHKDLARTEALVDITRFEEDHLRNELLRVYHNALDVLKTTPSLNNIEREMNNNQDLARRGLIAGTLLTESHRQRNDLIKSRNSLELKAIEALWRIYQLDGTIFEASL